VKRETTTMSDHTKIAGQVPGIMHEAAQHMRKLAEDNVELTQERDILFHENRLMKIAMRMEQRGLDPNLSFEEKMAKLEGVPAEKLATFEQAIEMAAGGFRLGTTESSRDGEKQASRGELYSASAGGDDLDNFVTTMRAYD
jgi:hypothetical protein